MKRLIEFVKSLTPADIGILVLALAALVVVTVGGVIGSARNEARITKLEAQKQQALKERDEARTQDLILQGQVKAKDEQIKDLTSQIAESNERVTNAHNETQSARATIDQVRRNPAHFNSANDAGRVVELGADLQRLYSDTP